MNRDLKIISIDGNPYNLQIIDNDGNNWVDGGNIASIDIRIRPNEVITANIVCYVPILNICIPSQENIENEIDDPLVISMINDTERL